MGILRGLGFGIPFRPLACPNAREFEPGGADLGQCPPRLGLAACRGELWLPRSQDPASGVRKLASGRKRSLRCWIPRRSTGSFASEHKQACALQTPTCRCLIPPRPAGSEASVCSNPPPASSRAPCGHAWRGIEVGRQGWIPGDPVAEPPADAHRDYPIHGIGGHGSRAIPRLGVSRHVRGHSHRAIVNDGASLTFVSLVRVICHFAVCEASHIL